MRRVKNMLSTKWKQFNELMEKCYLNMIGAEKDGGCWLQAFELLKECLVEERKVNPTFASELELIDDATDYEFDIQGWLEDCLDELDMWEEYEILLRMCDDLLELFEWPDNTGADINFRKSRALSALGRTKEAVEFCGDWIQRESENIVAATAGVYAFINAKEYCEAEKLVNQFILGASECNEENDIMFMAASKLYEAMGKKKEKREVDKALEKYEEYLEECFTSFDWEDDFEDEDEDELPFG